MNPRRSPLLAAVALILLSLVSIAAPRPAHAGERCFPETTHCVGGRFLQYWEQNGGLAVFGHPITPAREERNRDTGKTYLTQWFQRNRFELHPENQAPYDVLLGRLGDDVLFQKGRDWQMEHQPRASASGCETIVAGGKDFVLCPPFRDYYRAHGLEFDGRQGVSPAESLALFGLPLTQPNVETNSSGHTIVSQWFERARFEHHPNNPEPFKVLLGLLGNELQGNSAPAPVTGANVTYVERDGAVSERQSNGQTQRLGTLPAMGRVLDAARIGNRVVALREQGLQSLVVSGQATAIARFTRGNAEGGSLLAPTGSGKVIYAYVRSGDTQTGFTGIVGVIENGAARKVHEAPNRVSVLGLTKDERNMYLINWGGDPAIAEIQVRSLEDGALRARIPLPADAYMAAALSPDRNMLVTGSLATQYPDTLLVFDLNNAATAPRRVELPRRTWGATQLVWAPNSRVVYALAYPTTPQGVGELYRVDPPHGKAELVTGNIPLDARLHTVSPDGRWLLSEMQQRAAVIDLTNGAMQSHALPEGAVIAHW